MERQFVKIADKQFPRICDTTLIGDWEEVNGIDAQTLKAELSAEKLDGLIIRGYEMKWGAINENGEKYEKTAFDDFIQSYFVGKGLNMVVDINHEGYNDFKAICGRVLYIETNSVGFYFVVYIPRTYADYERVKWGLKEGILQGFSKEGYATNYEWHFDDEGNFEYELIKQMKLLSVSIVSSPANGVKFEKTQEIKNGLVYLNKEIKNAERVNTLDAMFNNKK